ncbi:MAG: 1,4-alpha-glucan branching enzyme, partial [Alphaproteobacteria bacterium]
MTSMGPERDTDAATWDAIAHGQHRDPFSVLGPHREAQARVVRCLQPQAQTVTLVDIAGKKLASMEQLHPEGIFVGRLPGRRRRYRLRLHLAGDETCDIEDPYRFPSPLGELDLHLIGEGTHERLYDKMGGHVARVLGVSGVHFAVWAPNAFRVSVIGDFNDWDGRRHVMRFHQSIGVWDIFIPGIGAGSLYKYELQDAAGALLPLKSDPFAQFAEPPPGNASMIYQSRYVWQDRAWMAARKDALGLDKPQSIYEVHLGSWRRRTEEENRWLSYAELAAELVTYVSDM